ncbi:MAG: outer membrane lipoprotein carrier protein LolA [Balneolaceae bacterium]
MNWEYDRNYRPVRITAWMVLFLVGFASIVEAQHPHFDRLQERFANGEMLTANFVHTYQDSYTGEQNRSDGEIWIAQNAYRVEDPRQTMIVDGEISRIYDAVRNRLLINTYIEEEDDFAPSRMLQGVREVYDVSEVESRSGISIRLTTDDPFELFYEVEIILTPEGVPLEIRALDQADNLLTTRFESGRFTSVDSAMFELDLPGDVERIDLRE